MKLLISHFKRNLRIWNVVVFSMSVVVGLFAGYYPRYIQQTLESELVETHEQYRKLSMSQLNYQIRNFSDFKNDQVPQSN